MARLGESGPPPRWIARMRKRKFNPVVPPKQILDPKFWEELFKKGSASVAWGKDWRLNIVAEPFKEIEGQRERSRFMGVKFQKKF